jgi:hypothetical protein
VSLSWYNQLLFLIDSDHQNVISSSTTQSGL